MPDEGVIRAFLPLFLRSLGALIFIPLSSESSAYFRNIAAAAILAGFLCVDYPAATQISFGGLIGEFCIGLVLGLSAVLLIEGASMIGELFDNGRGQNFAGLYDPLSGGHPSSMALMVQRFATALLLVSGYFEILISGLAQSLVSLPYGAVVASDFGEIGARMIPLIAQLMAGVFGCYLIFATLYICVDVAMVFINKVLTGASLSGESFQLKSYLGFGMLLLLIDLVSGGTLLTLARPPVELLQGF